METPYRYKIDMTHQYRFALVVGGRVDQVIYCPNRSFGYFMLGGPHKPHNVNPISPVSVPVPVAALCGV